MELTSSPFLTEQDRVIDELKREAAVAIGWTQAGLAASLLAINLLSVA